MSASRIQIEDNTLVLQGPVPAYDRGTLVSLSAALASNTEKISSIRCFSVHWDALPEEFMEWFEGILESNVFWDRIALAYCSGGLCARAMACLVQADRLEIYGHQLRGFLDFLGDSLGAPPGAAARATTKTVSYTHLTLPTKRIV